MNDIVAIGQVIDTVFANAQIITSICISRVNTAVVRTTSVLKANRTMKTNKVSEMNAQNRSSIVSQPIMFHP